MTVEEWLLDSDPAIRRQVMRHLTDEPVDVVAAERSRIAHKGWGARLLSLQGENGQWGGGTYMPVGTSTAFTPMLLREMGLDPRAPRSSPSDSREWKAISNS